MSEEEKGIIFLKQKFKVYRTHVQTTPFVLETGK
jgi:hypothetical protein